MIRSRSDDVVRTSAAQMDAALAAGLTAQQLAALVEARLCWQSTGVLPVDLPLLEEAIVHPAAHQWDAVFTTAARKLSAPAPSVRP